MTTFPVTTSTLSELELGKFITERYTLSDNYVCKLFRTGVNHTYFITGTETKYVARVYCHNWRTITEIEEEIKLLKLLQDNNLSVSSAIPDINGSYIQEINAPEGLRYMVLFTYATGEKIRFMTNESCSSIGSLMAKIHNTTVNKKLERVNYNSEVLLSQSYENLTLFFSEDLDEMKQIREFNEKIAEQFREYDKQENSKGIIHVDIWYDNLSIAGENEITLFDFDNCGNGWLILDVGYFCKQLFFIETDKIQYESKIKSFISGYLKERELADHSLEVIPATGAAIFIFYLGIQARRLDWSNIFLTKNYLNMMIERIRFWMDYYETKEIS
jgi:Ser/Thr protein kinase RdoA (MazF antagonist)